MHAYTGGQLAPGSWLRVPKPSLLHQVLHSTLFAYRTLSIFIHRSGIWVHSQVTVCGHEDLQQISVLQRGAIATMGLQQTSNFPLTTQSVHAQVVVQNACIRPNLRMLMRKLSSVHGWSSAPCCAFKAAVKVRVVHQPLIMVRQGDLYTPPWEHQVLDLESHYLDPRCLKFIKQ